MSVIEKLSDISNTLSDVFNFALQNEQIKNDFEEYLKTIGAYGAPESKIQSILIPYVFERVLNQNGDNVFKIYLKENTSIETHRKKIVDALQNSFSAVFEVKYVFKNGFELYNLVNEKDYTAMPLVKMSHLRGIYKGSFLIARLFKFENEYFILEISETASSMSKDNMLKRAVAKIIEQPESLYSDNEEKLVEIEKEILNFNSKFRECFDTDEIITTNTEADELISDFNDFCFDSSKSAEEVKSHIYEPEKYGFFKVGAFDSSYDKFMENSLGGFSSHADKYDVGVIYDENLGLFIVPFYGTLCKIFEADDYSSVEGYADCIKNFMENDKLPAALVLRLNNKYHNFMNIVNAVYETNYTIDELLAKYKAPHLERKILSPTSVLYSSKTFAELMGYIPTETKPNSIPDGIKPGRNELCPCGSGKKYKKCCGMV